MASRRRSRLALAAIAVSAALHLIALLTFSVSRDFEKGLRFRLAPRLDERRLQPPPVTPPEGRPDALRRAEGPGFRLPPLDPIEAPAGAELPIVAAARSLSPEVDDDRQPWVHPEEAHVELGQLEIELAARRADVETLEEYSRLYAGDANTSDAESRSHDRARMVVLRAIEAMGGIEALSALTELHAAVWIESTTHDLGVSIMRVPPYYYPTARWHFLTHLTIEPVAVRISLDPARPNLPYQLYNPGPDLAAYHSLFTNYWRNTPTALPNDGKRKRAEGVSRRWHFLDRFLSHDVRLGFVGAKRYMDMYGRSVSSVETILVNDHKYGQYFLASFSTTSGLLVAISEGYTEYERDWHFEMFGPPWLGEKSVTEYADYRPVDGVLLPHRIRRKNGSAVVSVQLIMTTDPDSLSHDPPEGP